MSTTEPVRRGTRLQILHFLLVCSAGMGLAQEEPFFKAGVANVRVDTAVTRNQSPVTGLRREDFVVLENGQPRPILAFSRDELPLDIILLVRLWIREFASPDANRNVTNRIQNGGANALLPLRPEDRAAIITYGGSWPNIELPFTNNRDAIAAAIQRAGALRASASGLWSEPLAIEYGVRLLREAGGSDPAALAERRRLIVLITGMFGEEYPDRPIIHSLWRENISLSTVDWFRPKGDFDNPSRVGRRIEPDNALYRQGNPVHIAYETGGDGRIFLDPEQPWDLLTRARQRYVLWISQPEGLAPGEQRSISVELSEEARKRLPDAVVQTRTGYFTR